MADHSITEVVEIICQVCSQEEHSAIECSWLYSPCTEPKCNGKRMILHSTTLRNRGKPFLKCQYGCTTSWKWLDEAIGLCTWCFNCGDKEHLSKDCPWSIMKCRCDGCDGRRYVWESQTNGFKFLNCYACNDFQWLTQVKRDAKTTTTSTIKAEPTITKENATICQVCAQEEHSALKCPWVNRPCIERNCNSILMIMVSRNSQNLGRIYLKCQNGFCAHSKQWLDEVIVKGGDSVPKGCSKCYDDHLDKNCPWNRLKCSHVNCNGKTVVYRTRKKCKTTGWRFLQCNACGKDFQWLMVAKRRRQKQLQVMNKSIKQEKIML